MIGISASKCPTGTACTMCPISIAIDITDTPQENYRYSDGYVYQVDPTTKLIQAAIQLIV